MKAAASISLDCDETHWPLAILVAEAAVNPEDIRSSVDQIASWLERSEPFALLLIVACNPVPPWDATTVEMAVQRIESAGEAIHRSLLGIAIVAPSVIFDTAWQSLARLRLDMPLEIFEKGTHAVEWLRRSVLAPANIAVDSL